jgi:DNA-binding transcriptional LysR family regulator
MVDARQFKLEGLTPQSALSQGIARLEQVVGARLLERDGRRRRLTNAGELVAGYARRVLGESEVLVDELADRRSGVAGTLRVGMIDAAALYLFRDQIAGFREAHPAIALSMTVAASSDLEQRLVDFRDDIAIVFGPLERVEGIALLAEPMNLYGYEDDPSAGTWALYPSGSRSRRVIDGGLSTAGIEARVVVESANPAVLRELAQLTGSFTVLPESLVDDRDRLPLVASDIARREAFAAVRSLSATSPLAAAFLEALRT